LWYIEFAKTPTITKRSKPWRIVTQYSIKLFIKGKDVHGRIGERGINSALDCLVHLSGAGMPEGHAKDRLVYAGNIAVITAEFVRTT